MKTPSPLICKAAKNLIKKLNYLEFIFLIIFLSFGLSSCTKQRYCAQCYENISGYQASDFCGESGEVDIYIEELKEEGSIQGQNWTCNKVIE